MLIFVIGLLCLILRAWVVLRVPGLSGFVLSDGHVTQVAYGGSIMTSNDAKDDGCYGMPAALVQWDTVQIGAVSGLVTYMTTSEAFVASQSCCAWGEWVGAKLVGFQMTWECLVPGCDLCHI